MITVVNHDTIPAYGNLFVDQFKLRHQEFIERQNYEVNEYHEMEYDRYDTPATTYLIFSDDKQKVQGVSRLTPVTKGCMLQDLWPELVEDKTQFEDDAIWESSRFCINKNLPAKFRREICYALALANVEFGLGKGIQKVIGMMPTLILRSVFERSGIYLERLGPIRNLPGFSKVQAAGIPINSEQVRNVEKKTGLFNVIGELKQSLDFKVAA